jgi:hypothetical protein
MAATGMVTAKLRTSWLKVSLRWVAKLPFGDNASTIQLISCMNIM